MILHFENPSCVDMIFAQISILGALETPCKRAPRLRLFVPQRAALLAAFCHNLRISRNRVFGGCVLPRWRSPLLPDLNGCYWVISEDENTHPPLMPDLKKVQSD